MEIIIPINRHLKVCQQCEELFFAQRSDAKYCSHSCRQIAFIKRKTLKQHIQAAPVQQPASVKKKDGIIKRFFKALW